MMDLLKASQVTVYAVGLLENTGSLRNELQHAAAADGRRQPAARRSFPPRSKDLDASYEKVLAEIKAQYQLGILSTNTAQDGSWRKVEIKVKRPGNQAPQSARAISPPTRNRAERARTGPEPGSVRRVGRTPPWYD